MNKNHERRHFSRVDFNTEATLLQNGTQWQTAVIDVSLKGLLVNGSFPADWDVQQPVDVSIPLSGATTIELRAQLAHQDTGHCGFICVSIDLESIAHLRRLIELNLGDAAAAEREIAELIVFKDIPMPENRTSPDRRNQPRFPIRAHAQLAYSTREWEAKMLDMSMTGARVTLLSEHLLRSGDHIKLLINSEEIGLHDVSKKRLQLHGQIVYLRDDILGVEYQPVTEMDKQLLVLLLAHTD